MRHGGRLLIEQLEAKGCTSVYSVPGESFLAALDGLYDSNRIQTVICRHESGAAIMAEAHGKLTGKPGVCIVTRGPGASNAMLGIHIAQQDSTPMILFVGMPQRGHRDREAFQEIDINAFFGSVSKWATFIDDASRIPEYVSRAYHTACSGRPGPVVLGLPEDMLRDRVRVSTIKPAQYAEARADSGSMAALADALGKASRPMMIVGGPGWSPKVSADVQEFAERFDLPVASSFRYQDYFDNRHPNYVGDFGIATDPHLAERIQASDFLIAMGVRLGEMTTRGYTLVKAPAPDQFLVHIYPGAEELGRVYRADIPIQSSISSFAAKLQHLEPPSPSPWEDWRKSARADYEASIVPQETPGAVKLEQIIATLSEMLDEDAIVTNGAGNSTGWLHRYFQYKKYRTQLAPTAGSMGYSLPAAISAKLLYPDRQVVCWAGDGCFLMTSQELATAIHYALPIIIIVANNNMYGTIRMHQEKTYPNRVLGTTLTNPDFAAYARSFGAHGETVEATEEFRSAFERAAASGKPAIIELKLDSEALNSRLTISQARKMAVPETA